MDRWSSWNEREREAAALGVRYATSWVERNNLPGIMGFEINDLVPPSIVRTVIVLEKPSSADRYAAVVAALWFAAMGLGVVGAILVAAFSAANAEFDEFVQAIWPIFTAIYVGCVYLIFKRLTRGKPVQVASPEYRQARQRLETAAWHGRGSELMRLKTLERQRKQEERARLRETWRLTGKEEWEPPAPPPPPGSISAAGPRAPVMAEEVAGAWLRWLGGRNVLVTTASRDGGIDVAASGIVAQVKWQEQPVSPARVREIFGVAQSRRERAAFFVGKAGYSREAVRFAEATDVLLFVMDDEAGRLGGATKSAKATLRTGIQAYLVT